MPLYDYKCPEHGVFHELAAMEDHAKPAPCPHCGKACGRIIMIPPEVLGMDKNLKHVLARNEKAQHEPVISNKEFRAEQKERELHARKHNHSGRGRGCSHSSHQHHAHDSKAQQIITNEPVTADTGALRQKAVLLADGSKIFPSQRPWMISH